MTVATTQIAALTVLLGLTLSIAIIDWRKLIIPDTLNFCLAIAGLVFSCVLPFPMQPDSVLGLIAGGVFAWALRSWHFRARGIEGLGFGDVKFIAAAGSWTGLFGLPAMLFLASSSGLAYCVYRYARCEPVARAQRLPFAPFLCVGLISIAGVQTAIGGSLYDLIEIFDPAEW